MENVVVIVLTTLPSEQDAEAFARVLVDERLAACVNILPAMRSIYRWQGVIERAAEQQLLIKTSEHRLNDLERRVRALHPYGVPEFLVVAVRSGSNDYLAWLSDSTTTLGPQDPQDLKTF